MNQTAKIVTAVMIALVLIALAVAVKMVWFPTVKEAWFQVNPQRLRQVPPGTVVVRPTHFPRTTTNSISYSNNGKGWMVGRNVTLQQMMAMAYAYDVGRVSIPPTAPKNNFDFVVTVMKPGNTLALQAEIKKQTGYVAKPEIQDADVLALKVTDPNSSGLKIADANEKQNTDFKNGRLYFTHTKISDITGGLDNFLKTPVVDTTGLTNYYDFSLAWKQNMNPNNFTRDQFDKILAEWGLALEPDTIPIEMLVVKKAK